MGKQAKKKDPKLKGTQKKHNPSTRGVNTTRQGPLWAVRQYKSKDDEGNTVIKSREVRVPVNTVWNPELMSKKAIEQGLPEPFDALHLDWANEMREHVSELNADEGVRAKVERTNLPNGRYNYAVVRKFDTGDEEVLYSIESDQNLNFGPAGKFSKK